MNYKGAVSWETTAFYFPLKQGLKLSPAHCREAVRDCRTTENRKFRFIFYRQPFSILIEDIFLMCEELTRCAFVCRVFL